MGKINKIANDLEGLGVESSRLLWTQYTTGFDFGVDAHEKKTTEYFKNKDTFRIVCEALNSDLKGDDRRGVELLHKAFKPHHYSEKANQIFEKITQLQTKLNDVLSKNRSEIDGRMVTGIDVTKILEDSSDRSQRKKAFLSRVSANKAVVDAGFLQLIELRKEYADACGFPDFVSFMLDKDELPANLFDGWREELKRRSSEMNRKTNQMAQGHIGVEEFQRWDYAYLKRTMCPQDVAEVDMDNFLEPIEKTFSAYGFDVSKLNLTYDIYPRKNKSEWGYMFNMEPCKDARILANVNNRFSSFNVLLHETGHGVHFLGLNPEEKLINLGVSGIVAEGFANFFGDRSYSREFLQQIFPGNIDPIYKSFMALRKLDRLRTFQFISQTLFDHELYRRKLRSLEDINELYWEHEKELLGREPYGDEPTWAYVIHHTTVPIYLHNYFLGDVMCENMRRVFAAHQGKSAEELPFEFGRFWQEKVLKPSGRYSFPELYERVCESKLNLGDYLDACL